MASNCSTFKGFQNKLVTHVSKILLFDRNDKLIIYLRDDKPTIPYPNHWDLLGGMVEEGESPTEAIIREVEEEVSLILDIPTYFGEYTSDEGDIFHMFQAQVDVTPETLVLLEGQRLTSIDLADRHQYRFGAMLGQVIDDFVKVARVG